MKAHFQKLYGMIGMTAMDAVIEEQCFPVALRGTRERALLDEMISLNDVDERHLICAEYLGYEKEAEQLRNWIKVKRTRKQIT